MNESITKEIVKEAMRITSKEVTPPLCVRLGLVKKENKMETILDAVKMVAVNFAEWLSKNEWKKKAKTHPKHIGKYWSDIHCEYKTINDLYEMFLVDERRRLKT